MWPIPRHYQVPCTVLTHAKDGLSIICVILRHIETEGIDHDTLLYCYLKVRQHSTQQPPNYFTLTL